VDATAKQPNKISVLKFRYNLDLILELY
jgi:hypothetical protein